MLGHKMPFGLGNLLGPFLLAWIVVLAGCAPAMNEGLIKPVGQDEHVGELQRNPVRQQPQRVVLEGRIVWLQPNDDLIVLEVTQPPLMESRDGPALFAGDEVLVAYRGPFDPKMYCLGRSVAVVGVIRERRPVPGQDAPELELNPVIEAKHIHLQPGHTALHSLTPSFLLSRDPFHRTFDPLHDPFRHPFCE